MKIINQTIFNSVKRPLYRGRFFYLLLIACVHVPLGNAKAQLMDSLAHSFTLKPGFYGTWDTKHSFISTNYAKIFSVKAGIDFGGITKLGIGFNWISNDMKRTIEDNEVSNEFNLRFRYVAVFMEYTYFRNKKWEATIPAQIGFGQIFYRKEGDGESKFYTQPAFLYEPMTTIQYRFLKYFAAGFGIGFRLILTEKNILKEQFNSPTAMLRTKIYFTDIYHDIFGKEIKRKKK